MRILALDLGKYKTVACEYEAETGGHRFVTVLTTPKALHDLIVDRAPQRVVIEICSIAGWVGDLVRSLGVELQVANTADERWRWRKVKQKNDRRDAITTPRGLPAWGPRSGGATPAVNQPGGANQRTLAAPS